ncbi:MAG: hypothetical protein KJ621_09675 [Proteobacteria bacterium]|nr:hypothetical protein [Pseudomonadota bacterium]
MGHKHLQGAAWTLAGALCLAAWAMTFMRPPAHIAAWLQQTATNVQTWSLILHVVMLVVLAAGLALRPLRNHLFAAFMALITLSATVISIIQGLYPNIIIFGLVFGLIVQAWATGKLNFDQRGQRPIPALFGLGGLIFGFWYLHWVPGPVALTALYHSPLGALNCPTLVTICGFLCLTNKPRSHLLEAVTAGSTLFFGFYGLMRLGAWVDVSLILCATFLILRLGARAAETGRLDARPETGQTKRT